MFNSNQIRNFTAIFVWIGALGVLVSLDYKLAGVLPIKWIIFAGLVWHGFRIFKRKIF